MRELQLRGGAQQRDEIIAAVAVISLPVSLKKSGRTCFFLRPVEIFHRLKERERESRLVTGFRSSILSGNSGTVSVLRVNPEIGTQVTLLMSNNHA